MKFPMILVACLVCFASLCGADKPKDRGDIVTTRSEAFGLPFGKIQIVNDRGHVSVSCKGSNASFSATSSVKNNKVEFSAVALTQGQIKGVTGVITMLPNGGSKIEYNIDLGNGYEAGSMMAFVNAGGPTVLFPQTCDCTDGIDLHCTTAKCNAGDDCSATNTKKCKWLVGTPTYNPSKVTWPPQPSQIPDFGYPFYVCDTQ